MRREGKTTNELLTFAAAQLKRIDPPEGWMTPAGYNRRVAAQKRRRRGE